MRKPGSILQIVVKDFVTYSYVELEPGPNLNMIIGPNGSGKSTIVAAIILGLGGNPKTVGRGTKISEYVKYECQQASIQITLQGNNDSEKICIRRRFDTSEKTTWELNGRKVTLKEIEKTIQQFNIQVDNLCQFLPQDKVQDFAKMNKQQLLEQTQIAICRNDLREKQLSLINFRERHKDIQTKMENNVKQLQELRDANVRIEEKVKNLTKKEKFMKFIEDVDRKVAWTKYHNLRIKIDEMKEDKLKATEALSQHVTSLRPIQTAINNAQKVIKAIEEKIKNQSKIVRSHEAVVEGKLNTCSRIKSSITDMQDDLNSRLQEVETRNEEIRKIKDEIAELTTKKSEFTLINDAERENRIKSLNEEIKQTTARMNKDVQRKGEIERSKENKRYELRCLQTELEKLENIKQQRLEWLRRMDKDAYRGVNWLRDNKRIFKGEVYEPMILELNVLNPNHAIYVESSIPLRDRIAFTCVVKEDMNTLILKLREEQHLNVNIVHSGMDHTGLHRYQPIIPIEQLKPFGMFAYIKSLVTGPPPIMNYLCKTYQIHNTPVGNNLTNERFERVPPEIKNFFSDTFRFSTSFSKYTKEKSTRQMEIRSDGSLAISMDAERIENIKGQLTEVQQSYSKCDEQISTLNDQIHQYNQTLSSIRENFQELKRQKQEFDTLESRIRVLKNKLRHLEQNEVTAEQIENEYNAQIMHAVNQMVTAQNELGAAFEQYSQIILDADLDKINLDTNHKQVVFLRNKSQDLETLRQKTQETLNVIKAKYTSAVSEGKSALSKAKQLSKGFTPEDEGFNEFREVYDSLPNDLEQLDLEKEDTLSKIDCLNTADVKELEEYHKRQKQITKYEEDIERGQSDINRANLNLDKLQKEWLDPLEELVQEINTKFSNAFKQMGCAGEISIYKGENEQNFSEYGISIKVKYRDSQPLQELNNIVQSGGERAVATAAYMLSLQELTPVPFRCVDEINQGMDANNERRIFELLVDATTQTDTSQYFFITPKLVPNLKFVKGMTVHVVHNAPFLSTKCKWNNVMVHEKRRVTS